MRVKSGPYRTTKLLTADSVISAKAVALGGYTFINSTGAAITATFFDDVSTGGTNDIDVVVVPANSSVNVNDHGAETLNGLVVKASTWTGLTGYARWAPR